MHQLMPGTQSFNVAGAVRVRGGLDEATLAIAWSRLIDHHPALRTTFAVRDGRPAQIVHEQMPIRIKTVDGRGWTSDRVQAFLEKEAHAAFDLNQGPLARLISLQTDAGPVLLLAMDHLITDFWSISLLVAALGQLYLAVSQGEASILPPAQRHYGDFARWQADMLAGAEGERLWSYWREQLSGELPALNLPTDRPRGAVQTFRGDMISFQFDAELAAGLGALSRARGATLFTTLLAAFQTLLHRITGQTDLLVGSVMAGRDRPELADVMGYFINPVALRASFSDNPRFTTLLQQVRQTVLDAYAHQAFPLPLLADRLHLRQQLGPASSRPPLFESMFILQKGQIAAGDDWSPFALNQTGAKYNLGSLTLESLSLGGQPAQFDLTLMMAEMDGGLGASLFFNTDLFDRTTAARLLAYLEVLLREIVAGPDRPVSDYSLLPMNVQQEILRDWNDSAAPYPQARTLPALVARQAAQTPRKTAIIYENEALTYAELQAQANQLANHLQAQGVQSGDLVGVSLERSAQMLVGLLGIMGAGAAYVPLDPAFPAPRLALMIDDARPVLILSEGGSTDQLKNLEGVTLPPLVELDRDWPAIAMQATKAPTVQLLPDDLAYVIYTSGSTGRPKGVQVPHAGVVNFLTSMAAAPGLTAADRLLAVTTISFDIHVLELFLPLTRGATVMIASRDLAADGTALAGALTGATVMQATPATWQLLLNAGWSGQPGLKILCGGEALPPALAAALLSRGDELWNLYGPTETTIWSTVERIQKADTAITIGRPIANTQVYVLDRQLAPVPPGVVGDLYIGGDGVTRGYLNRPALTATRFVPDPYSDRPGARLYATGDLVRFSSDGRLFFLGRGDHQVKVRGFRIELGDIETALSRHPAVTQAIVLAHGQDANRQLAAYYKTNAEAATTTASLRHFLAEQLPAYMVPAAFVALDDFPLLPNGKVNRAALPVPTSDQRREKQAYVAPRNDLENTLAAISAQVLGIERVSVFDNFFDLGGNSLLATQLIFQVRQELSVALPLRELFADPTVAHLAQQVTTARENGVLQVNGQHQPLFPAMSLTNLLTQVKLDPAIQAGDRPVANNDAEHILLTGATGFVGAFLLRDLLEMTTAHVHCLVRAADEAAAFEARPDKPDPLRPLARCLCQEDHRSTRRPGRTTVGPGPGAFRPAGGAN